jgi:universal stress protein A
MKFQRILHPTDFSPPSAAAFAAATELAAALRAELIALHVCPLTATVELTGVTLSHTTPTAELDRRLRAACPAPDGITVTYRVEHGEPEVLIPRAAQHLHADLIVMGTHGRTGLLDRMFVGSVAEQLVRAAPCPVLTVREPHPPAATT